MSKIPQVLRSIADLIESEERHEFHVCDDGPEEVKIPTVSQAPIFDEDGKQIGEQEKTEYEFKEFEDIRIWTTEGITLACLRKSRIEMTYVQISKATGLSVHHVQVAVSRLSAKKSVERTGVGIKALIKAI